MNKFANVIAIFLASVAAVVACTNEIDAQVEEVNETPAKTYTLTLNAGSPETKTIFGEKEGTSYPITWSSTGEIIQLAEVYTPAVGDPVVAAFPSTGYTLTNSNATASFTVDLTEKTSDGTYDYRVIYPSTAYTAVYPANDDLAVLVPGTQTPTATSPDPAATVLYAEVSGLTAQPTSTLDLDFSHITAYGKMTVKSAGSAIRGGETIQSVTVSVPAGGFYYYWDTGNTVPIAATKTSEVVVNTDNLDTSGNFDVWFACKPYSLSIGDILTVKITTDADTYVRSIILTKALAFTAGEVSKFGVDMSSAAPLIYSTDFNYSLVKEGSNTYYNSSNEYEGVDAGGQTSWYIKYGNWYNSNSAQLRVYSSGGGFGEIAQKFDCSHVTTVFYDAVANNENTTLTLTPYYSTNMGSTWSAISADAQVISTTKKTYKFTVSSTGEHNRVRVKLVVSGSRPSSSNTQITVDNLKIYGTGAVLADPSISASNVSDVPAIGGSGRTLTYTINNFSGADDITATPDNTVVTSATVTSAGTVTYTVAPNYATSARSTGTITLASPREGVNKVITVSQLGESFSVSTTTVTILKDATTGTFTITTPSFGWATTVAPADGKNLTLSNPTFGSGNASAQTITVNSTTSATASEQTLGTVVVYRNGNASDPQAKTITIKKASNVVASTYTKVTSISEGTYLICNAASNKVISGVGDYFSTTSVTISGGTTITGNDTLTDYEFTITALTGSDAGKYSIVFNSNYVAWNTSTKVKQNATLTDKAKWTISIDGNGLATIQTNDTNAGKYRYWGWNGTNNQYRAYQYDSTVDDPAYTYTPFPTLFKKN